MISPAQARALRAIVVDAVTLDVPPAVQASAAELVVWAGQDHPAPGFPCAVLQTIASEQVDADGERINVLLGTGELVQRVRTIYDVTISVQFATQRDDAAPELSHNAWILARRFVSRLQSEPARDALSTLGTGVQRLSGIRDLSTLIRGSQSESRVAVDVVLRIAVVDEFRPGWIETLEGEGTLSGELVIPFEAQALERTSSLTAIGEGSFEATPS